MTDEGFYRDAVAVVTGFRPADQAGQLMRQRFLTLLAEQPGAVRADHPDAHLTASAVIVSGDRQRVLLCLHGRINRWVQLGGHTEPGDATLLATATREAREESGIPDLVSSPLPIDLDVHQVSCRLGASWHFDVRFAFLAPPDAAFTISTESRELGWFTPDALPQPLASATAQLVAPAIEAVRDLVARPAHR